MITLSEFLGTIPCAGNAHNSVQIAIREAKRLESLEAPRIKAERKPLVDAERKPLLYGDGDGLYVVVDSCGHVSDCSYERKEMESFAERVASKTGQPHTICQVMAPVDGECPTIPVATFMPTPERPHEWVVCNPLRDDHYHWFGTRYAMGEVVEWWYAGTSYREVTRFSTEAEAQTYIDSNNLTDAFPWPVPKLSE